MNLRLPSKRGMFFRARGIVYHLNRLAGRYRKKLWIVGDGRSGTTWLANLVNYRADQRLLFEPFHPLWEPEMRRFDPILYVRPGASEPELEARVRDTFKGRIHSYWNDEYPPDRLIQNGLIVKSIFSHMFIGWAHALLPDVRKIVILRHPCAVAASKCKVKGSWVVEPQLFWGKKELREDFLLPYEEIIKNEVDPFLKYIVCWCILHTVLLRHCENFGIPVVCYEDLCLTPDLVLPALYAAAGIDNSEDEEISSAYAAVSPTSSGSASARNRALGWVQEVDPNRVEQARYIISTFSLEHIYKADDPQPRFLTRLAAQPTS